MRLASIYTTKAYLSWFSPKGLFSANGLKVPKIGGGNAFWDSISGISMPVIDSN
jgi:hypothetical protein